MSSWNAFPEGSWKLVGRTSLSGFGKGEGAYGLAYAIDTNISRFLNGRVSAQFQFAGGRAVVGAGVVARASSLRSFAAFYILSDESQNDLYGIRLAAFKFGKLEVLVGLKRNVSLVKRQFHISLQFFSGELIGQVVTEHDIYTLKHTLPEVPFPGHCGVIRFYSSPAVASNLHIEEMSMRPILPEESAEVQHDPHTFCTFISYSNADKPAILRLTEALRSKGISYWVDHEQITFGDGIISKIEEGLKKSKFVVVCLSESLARSGWCRAEYGPILYREFSGDTSRRVIPLSLDGLRNSDAVPLLLSDKMRADFTDQNSFSAFLEFLRKAASTP